MLFAEFLLVLLLALVVTALFSFSEARYRWPDLMALFIVLLLGTWALGVWFRPIGRPVGGVYWASFLIAISAITLLLLLTIGKVGPRPGWPERRAGRGAVEYRQLTPAEEKLEEEKAEAEAAASLGTVFWVVVVLALVALLAHYAFPGFD